MHKKTRLFLALFLGFSLVFCSSAMAADRIKIGCILPLTGPYAALGDDQQKGAELAADFYNSQGGVLGKKVEILVRDSQLNGGIALRKAKELVSERKVDFIAGSLSGAVSKVINEFSAKNKVIYMGFPQSDMVTGEDINRYGFSGMVSPYMCAMAISKYAFENLGKSWYSLTADYRWGHRLLQGWLHSSNVYGGKFLGNVYAPLGTSDFSAFLPKIMAANPDFIVYNNLGRDQNASLKQASEMGLIGPKKIVCTKTTVLTMKEIYPIYDDNIYGGVDFYWELQEKYKTAKKFVKAFWGKYGRPPRQDGESGYNQIMALLAAVKKAGTTDPDSVVKALEEMKYSFTKGEEYYQKCNHQRAETQIILRGLGKKAKGWRVAEVIAEIPASDTMRNCEWAKKDLPNANIPLPR